RGVGADGRARHDRPVPLGGQYGDGGAAQALLGQARAGRVLGWEGFCSPGESSGAELPAGRNPGPAPDRGGSPAVVRVGPRTPAALLRVPTRGERVGLRGGGFYAAPGIRSQRLGRPVPGPGVLVPEPVIWCARRGRT